ncbi:hypothetical protein [Jiella avicenniae]|uniref:Uncharacterized protein n=1 Tax=Jiella avicenniae TaxID=2907202 RepID=A0A9X1P3Q1_9HYPH|nr:hypothetical protein [Jiella avicenniae]MCE7030437.1 hypothetical protein [Jiella avicenniae]
MGRNRIKTTAAFVTVSAIGYGATAYGAFLFGQLLQSIDDTGDRAISDLVFGSNYTIEILLSMMAVSAVSALLALWLFVTVQREPELERKIKREEGPDRLA